MDYPEYLKTPEWRRIRRRVLKRDGRRCQRCGGRGNEVHHRSYEDAVMLGQDDSKLVTVCSGCHKCIEKDDSGRKHSPEEKERVLMTPPSVDDLPPPLKVDLRRPILALPAGSERMSSTQIVAFINRQRELIRQKREQLRLKKDRRKQRVAEYAHAPA